MGAKKPPGLRKRGQTWHILKTVDGIRIQESTGTGDLNEATRYLNHRLEQLRQQRVYGIRPARCWREAATKYLLESGHKRSLADDAMHLKELDAWIGDLPLQQVHLGTLSPWIAHRRQQGIKTKSINLALGVVRHILNLAARLWRDEAGLTWLETAPLIAMLPVTDANSPYPLSREEFQRLREQLPAHLAIMATWAVHTGCREQEICQLRWEWETRLEGLETVVFTLPSALTKSRQDRLVVCNQTAVAMLNAVRGQHEDVVFTWQGQPISRMNSSAWRRSWRAAGLPTEGVTHGPHNLRHTCGRWLRAAGVPLETRKAILGHRIQDITTHYSQAEIAELLTAVRRLDDAGSLTILRTVPRQTKLSQC